MQSNRKRADIARRRRRRARFGSPTFRQLVMRLSERIGRHQIPADPDATEIASIVGPDGIHPAIIPGVLRDVYRANGCGHLDARIRLEPTFEALGAAWQRLRRGDRTDVEQIELIETLGTEVRAFFAAQQEDTLPRSAGPTRSAEGVGATAKERLGTGEPSGL